MQIIQKIVLYNRTDCCGERLNNFRVQVSNDGNTWSNVHEELGNAGPIMVIPNNMGKTGRHVRVQLRGTGYLGLAEVEIFALPDPSVTSLTIAPPHYPPGTTNDLHWGLTYQINNNLNPQGYFCGWTDVGGTTLRSNCTPGVSRSDRVHITARGSTAATSSRVGPATLG